MHVCDEILPADQLHDEEGLFRFGHHELVEAHEVAVPHVGENAKLLLEAIKVRRSEPDERLDRERLSVLEVADFVHDAHAALADAAHHLVAVCPSPLGRA
jgi:hypothetical protein